MSRLALVFLALALPAVAAEPAPGTRFSVSPADLPPVGATPSVANPPAVRPRPPGAALAVPKGFTATLFAEGLRHARELAAAPGGDIFLAEPNAGRVTVLRDADGDGRAEVVETFAEGFSRPHGMAFHGGHFYVADLNAVWRVAYRPGESRAAGPFQQMTPPGALGGTGGHWTRNLAIPPAGGRLYVSIGSRGNLGEEALPRASIQEFPISGGAGRSFATGLRNPVGIAFRPGTDELWAVVNERDGQGDGLVPDYLTDVREGGFYGWPYAYIGPNPQPDYADKRPDLVAKTLVPDLLFQSHSAPLGLAFYSGTQFPPEYRDDAFVGLHGSWNAGQPVGYFVARVPFADGKPDGSYEVFASGFRIGGGDRAEVWGRPVGVTVGADGSLFIADDVGNTVWRVKWP